MLLVVQGEYRLNSSTPHLSGTSPLTHTPRAPPLRVVTTVVKLLAEKGDYDAAERTLERALAMRRRLLGEHADVAVTLVELARVYQDQGFNQRSEPLEREALAIRVKAGGS